MVAESPGLRGDRRKITSPGDGVTGSSARLLRCCPRLLPTVASARWEHSRRARSKQSLIVQRDANCFHLLVDLHLCEVLFVSFALKRSAGRAVGSLLGQQTSSFRRTLVITPDAKKQLKLARLAVVKDRLARLCTPLQEKWSPGSFGQRVNSSSGTCQQALRVTTRDADAPSPKLVWSFRSLEMPEQVRREELRVGSVRCSTVIMLFICTVCAN